MAQHGPFFGLADHMGDTLRDRDIPDIPVIQYFFGCDRHTVGHTVKFRQGDGNGNLHGVHAFQIVLPLFIFRKKRIGSQYRYIPLFQKIQFKGAAGCQGEFGYIDKNIYYGKSLFKEKAAEHFIQRRHSHFFIGHSVAEGTDDIKPLLFRFFNQPALIFQVAPHPFIPVKQDSYCKPPRAAEIFFILCQIRIYLFCPWVKDSRPMDRIRFCHSRSISRSQSVHILPEVIQVAFAPVNGI